MRRLAWHVQGVTTAVPRSPPFADGELLRLAQGQAEGAFTALYRRHAAYVAGVVFRILGRDGDVDDVLQETFVDAFDALASLEDPARLRPWLVAIAVRKTHKLLARRRRRQMFGLHLAFFAPHASDPHHRAAADELYDALDRIPPDLRIPWVLHRIEAMSLPDVAVACDVSLATIKRRIAEAEARLRRRLDP